MRRHLILAAVLLDGLCALAAPLVLPAVTAEDRSEYTEIAGACVEVVRDAGAATVWHFVDAAHCR